jgi:ferric-dicitrate binding protein FerR (iron transport regulator)
MKNSSDEVVARADDAIEVLLGRATPRPSPPGDDEMAVHAAVHAEWRAVTRKVKTRRRTINLAIAATVLLGVAITFNALQVSDIATVQVATISKSHGSIYLLGEHSEMHEMTDLSSISAGQFIVTDDNAGIGLVWGSGGSLRVGENTRIEFMSASSVYLHSGQIYFDSQSATQAADTSNTGFTVETDHGSVKHLGTQYMTYSGTSSLTVSVREGQVAVDGSYVAKAVVVSGQQMTISGGARPVVTDFKVYGEAWNWIEATSPAIDVDGRTVNEFLTAIGREIGLQVSYVSPEAEQMAHNGVLKGNVDMGPRDELAFRMSGEDLSYRIDGGAIYVSFDPGGRP